MENKSFEDTIMQICKNTYDEGMFDMKELVIEIIDRFPDIKLLELKNILKNSAEYFPKTYLTSYEKVEE